MARRRKKLDLTDDEWDVVLCNLGLVNHVVRRVAARAGIRGQEVDAMRSSGTLGLADAVSSCIAEKGSLVTHGDRRIREAVQVHRHKNRVIHTPRKWDYREHPILSPLARRATTTTATDLCDDLDFEGLFSGLGPADADAERREAVERVAEAVGRLPERQREIVEARMRGESLREIGERMGRTKQRAGQIEAEAHKKLRVMLADYA